MSNFCGIVDEIANISIDRFDGNNLSSTAYFLTHCHTDHMQGLFYGSFLHRLESNKDVYLYCSEISYHILMDTPLNSVKDSIKVVSHLFESLIEVPGTEKYPELQFLTVTVIPAGHCPGSVMFVFECNKRILYTGDIRLVEGDTRKMKQLLTCDGNAKRFDTLYLDTTFLKTEYSYFPQRKDSADVLCKLISEWLSHSLQNIYLNNYVFIDVPAKHGSEYLFIEIFKTLKLKVHVSAEHYNIYRNVPEVETTITASAGISQIHACWPMCEFIKEKKKERVVRFIKPSAMWYKNGKEGDAIYKDREYNNFSVAYSSHSSFSELKDIVDFLQPNKIVPCVIPRASNAEDIKNTIDQLRQSTGGAS